MWYIFDKSFTLQGVIDSFTQSIITYDFTECDIINFNLPYTENFYQTLQKERILYRYETGKAYILHTVEVSKNEIWGTGYGLESVLDTRIIPNPISLNYAVETVMHNLVDWNIVNPGLSYRKIPNFIKGNNLARGGTVSVAYFGESLYEVFCDLNKQGNIGYRVVYDVLNKQYLFETFVGTDRTVNQNDVNPVWFRSEWNQTRDESILTSVKDEKNVVYLASGDEVPLRVQTTVDGSVETTKTGWNRKEIFLSASDISNKLYKDGTETVISVQEETDMLKQRGRLELLNHYPINDFKFTLDNDVPFVFGRDYFIGDKISVTNGAFGITRHQIVQKVEETILNGNSQFSITFQ